MSPAPYDLHSELPSGYGYELPNSPRWARWDYGRHTFSISRARREGQLIEAKWPGIVDPKIFEAAQRQIVRNRRGGGWTPARARHYVFPGLLQCAHCGRPMRAKTNYSAFYYYCRNDVALGQQCPGARAGVREERLLPWAGYLIEKIDCLTPEGFAEAVQRSAPRRKAPTSIAAIDKALARLQDMYTWEDISPSDYQRKRGELLLTRSQLTAVTTNKPVVNIYGLLSAWRTGDLVTRRELLLTLFDTLIVRDGEIVEYIPRKDRAAEVEALISAALGGSDEIGGATGLGRSTWPVSGSMSGTGGTTVNSWLDSSGTIRAMSATSS